MKNMFEDLIKEYNCLKTDAECAVRFASMLQSLICALNENSKHDRDYYVRRSKELLEEYYRREV